MKIMYPFLPIHICAIKSSVATRLVDTNLFFIDPENFSQFLFSFFKTFKRNTRFFIPTGFSQYEHVKNENF